MNCFNWKDNFSIPQFKSQCFYLHKRDEIQQIYSSLLVCSKMVISDLFGTSKVPLLLLLFLHAEGSVGHVGYPPPPLWKDVPESLDEFTSQNNKIVINPWNYIERMGMYKLLLNATAKYMTFLGPNNTGNVLWGLPLQHGWQFHTGMEILSGFILYLSNSRSSS